MNKLLRKDLELRDRNQMQRLAQNLLHQLCTYNPRQKSWHTCVRFPFPNVDLSITVVSLLQNRCGSTVGRVRAHYSENKIVRSKSQEFSRKFKRSGVSNQNPFKSNPLFRHVTPRSTKVLVKTRTCIQIRKLKIKKKNYARNLYMTTVKILAINRSTKWLKAESKTKTIYKHSTLSHVSFKRSLK